MNHNLSNNKQEKGQGLVEYALILVLVAIVVIGVLIVLGPKIGGIFSSVNGSLSGIGGGGAQTTTAPTQPAIITGDAARAEYCAERPGWTGGVNWGFAGGHQWTNNGQTYYVTGDPFNCPYP